MSMAQRRQPVAAPMPGWLEDVQRDPRTVGAFRRRIEALLCDGVVARRVAERLERREAENRVSPDDSLPAPCTLAAPEETGTPVDRIPLKPRALLDAFLRDESGLVSLIGRCDCSTGCCLMVPDLRRFPNHVPAAPSLARGTPMRH